MNAARPLDPLTSALIGATIAGLTLLVAVVTAVAWGPGARAWLGFGFGGVTPTFTSAVSIFANNMKLAGAVAIAAALAQMRLGGPGGVRASLGEPVLRWLLRACDAGLAIAAAVNIAIVGVALGSYGSRMATAMVPHGPVELSGYCVALNFYVAARRRPLERRAWLVAAGLTTALIAAAALLETFAWLG
jgi:hypothetical protein